MFGFPKITFCEVCSIGFKPYNANWGSPYEKYNGLCPTHREAKIKDDMHMDRVLSWVKKCENFATVEKLMVEAEAKEAKECNERFGSLAAGAAQDIASETAKDLLSKQQAMAQSLNSTYMPGTCYGPR
jgi:hypothetical protein